MRAETDESLLDDVAALQALDAGGMLPAVAGSAAQVRSASTTAKEADLRRLADLGRPRAVVVAGMGGSALAGDALGAVAEAASRVPVLTVRGFVLPAWVGSADLVAAVSYSGRTEETLALAEEAARRGSPLLAVAPADSPLAALADRCRGVVLPVGAGHSPRVSFWTLATLVVVGAARLGVVEGGAGLDTALEAAAVRLEELAVRCRPASESFLNPAKALALGLAGSLPMAWGTSAVGGVAAYRLACQWSENAKAPAIAGVLPEAGHNAIVSLSGSWVGGPDDLFRDPADREAALSLLLLRDVVEHPRVRRQADVIGDLAGERGVPVTQLTAEGASAYERLASLVGLLDYTSVYLALLTGVDPSPILLIDALKNRTAR